MIPFTQYIMSNGRTVATGCERSADVEAKAFALLGAGAHFDAELRGVEVVSLTCKVTDRDDEFPDGLVSIRVVAQRSQRETAAVETAIDELVDEAYVRMGLA